MLLDKDEHYKQLQEAMDKGEEWIIIHQNYSKQLSCELAYYLKMHGHNVSYWSERGLTRIYINNSDAYIYFSVTGKRFNIHNYHKLKVNYFNRIRELVDEIEHKYIIKSFALPGYFAYQTY